MSKNLANMFDGDWDDEISRSFEEFKEEHEILPNIMVLGRTGVGKSSLINTIFGKEVAKVSDIVPETQYFEFYNGEEMDLDVNLIDSKGYEINDGADNAEECMAKYINGVKKCLEEQCEKAEPVHMIWYCISVNEERVEPIDEMLISELGKLEMTRGKVAVVLTKCDEDDEDAENGEGIKAKALKNVLAEIGVKPSDMFEVSNDSSLKLDMDKLKDWCIEQLDDEALKLNFWAALSTDLVQKKKAANKVIKLAVGTSGTVGAIPIKTGLTDAAALTGIQIMLFFKIAHIYNIKVPMIAFTAFLKNDILSILGKNLSSLLWSVIPGAGNVINATVAGAITYAFGVSVQIACEKVCKAKLNGEKLPLKEALSDFMLVFTEVFKHKMDKN